MMDVYGADVSDSDDFLQSLMDMVPDYKRIEKTISAKVKLENKNISQTLQSTHRSWKCDTIFTESNSKYISHFHPPHEEESSCILWDMFGADRFLLASVSSKGGCSKHAYEGEREFLDNGIEFGGRTYMMLGGEPKDEKKNKQKVEEKALEFVCWMFAVSDRYNFLTHVHRDDVREYLGNFPK